MANALARSQSPYLRQHADNPVDWVEWSAAAFEEARRRDVPLLVSIGYATCHWCHVMAHESFEDADTARLMNEHFVCIKVDREELPEVDEIYMDAVQALTGHGGWPLNAFVDHDGRPFFAGTYYPRTNWQHLVEALAEAFAENREEVAKTAHDVAAHLTKMAASHARDVPADIWPNLARELAARFDTEHPGFALQPKFPPSQTLHLLVTRPEPPDLAEKVLEAMQDSGTHERVGGGFHRYATDRAWRVPHFEKMLYDNAQLIATYALAGIRLGRRDFLQTAVNATDYVLRDLRVETDRFIGYASAEDADDPGGEGSFYAWSPDALKVVLGPDGERLADAWDIRFGEPEVGRSGHLEPVATHIPHPRGKGTPTQDERASWEPSLPKLRAMRDLRPRPIRDDKVLTDLNGLFLAGLATVARLTGEARFVMATRELVDVMLTRLTSDGLVRMPGRPAYVTDYGHLAVGLIEVYRLLGDASLITTASAIVDEAVAKLAAADGGFYTTPPGRGDLIRRSREHADNAYPAGAHALALASVRLSHLTHEPRFADIARGVMRAQAVVLGRAPSACATLLQALFELEVGATTVVVAGAGAEAEALLGVARRAPRTDVYAVPAHADVSWPILEGRRGTDVRAFVCQGTVCKLPTSDRNAVASALDMR